MSQSSAGSPRRRAVLGVLGATIILALCLTAAGVARTGDTHRAYAARIARAHRLARGLRGAAVRQTFFDQAVKAAGSRSSANHTPNDGDLADQLAAYNNERLAPGTAVSGEALVAGEQQANGLGRLGAAWQEVTNQPYNASPPYSTDPNFGNVGSGFSIVGGRTTALTAAPNGTWYAGTADGGVWSTRDKGATWSPLTDGLSSLSIGALAINPVDGSVWVGTGEANTNQDSYAGIGVYRIDGTGGIGRVGDAAGTNPLSGRTIYQITFDPQGNAYAATNNGLFRYATGSGQWTEVLAPDGPNQPGSAAYSPYNDHITTVAVVPGSQGKDVIAVEGWRGPVSGQKNGFYESKDGGNTFAPVTPTGDINAADIGRTTFAYSSDASKLYAVVESPAALTAGGESVLQGVFLASGTSSATSVKPASVAGPWTKIADETKLADSGSALAVGSGYGVGVQAWYNQTLAVDPAHPGHVYLGLEEVFQSTNAGTTWSTAAPYWNYPPLPCNPNCPDTTHPDQHALMIAGGQVVSGNDGGVYARALANTEQYGGWTNTNNTLHALQYYDARAGFQAGTGTRVYGGLQDNGTSALTLGARQNEEPAGGDGTTVIVDPAHANKMVGSYVDGAMYSSTDGGHTFYDEVSPGCVGQATVGVKPRADCDPNIRFVTPMTQDQRNANDWVVGGQFVWVSRAGWKTSCTPTDCSWQNVFDTGSGNAVTALSSVRDAKTIYAAWVGGGGNPGPAFSRGIATNYGGSWHQTSMVGLPNRYIAGVTVDPENPAHAYAVFNGYSRRWIPAGGVGHVYETLDGGQSWNDISGNLPDVPADALLLTHKQLALATDLGMYTARQGRGARTTWYRLGVGLPNASVDNVTPGPDGYIYASTHGRGIWRLPFGHGQGEH